MDGNNHENQNQISQDDDVSVLDKIIQNNPFVNKNVEYQNVQTKSVVESARDNVGNQLASVNAYNAEALRQQKKAEEAAKLRHTIAIIAVIVLGLGVIGASVWIGISIYNNNRGVAQTESGSGEQSGTDKTKVGDYKCQSSDCKQEVETTIGSTILIRDGLKYYLFNTDAKKTTLTAIPEEKYSEIIPFKWGEKDYVVLKNGDSRSALFSLTDNRQITNFAYDYFHTDINATHYMSLEHIEGKYIIAYRSGAYRLVDVNDASEIVQGEKRVFAYNDYFFGYDQDSSIHAYSQGKLIFSAGPDDFIFVKGDQIILITGTSYNIFERDGSASKNTEILRYLKSIDADQRAKTLSGNSEYHLIPR